MRRDGYEYLEVELRLLQEDPMFRHLYARQEFDTLCNEIIFKTTHQVRPNKFNKTNGAKAHFWRKICFDMPTYRAITTAYQC